MARDPYKYFRIEARELAEQMNREVLELEKSTAPAEVLQTLLRLAHTLKGAARVVKQGGIADDAHSIEDLLVPCRESADSIPTQSIDALLNLLDRIGKQVSALGSATETILHTPEKMPEELFHSVRAGSGDMEELLTGVTEACVQIGTLRRRLTTLERMGHLTALLGEQLVAERDIKSINTSSQHMARSIAEDLSGLLAGLERDAALDVDRLDAELRQLRETVEHLRLVPFDMVFTVLARMVRDTAQAVNKVAAFEGIGGEIRVDGEVLAALQGALIQLVRNAVVHGIEGAAERSARGKSPTGSVTLRVIRNGRRTTFTCTDDGRGIDLDEVRKAAQRRGMIPADWPVDREELLRVILRSGLTTEAGASDVSGRGVGLDVVREIAERLGGEVRIQTESGKGTAIEIGVPLSLASLDALIVETGADGSNAAIPVESIRKTMRLFSHNLSRTAEAESMLCDGTIVPFLPLRRILSTKDRIAPRETWSVVVIEGKKGVVALGVDRLVGISKIVLRPLPGLIAQPRAVAGAALDPEGNPQLVLDPDGLIAEAQNAAAANHEPAPRFAPILIVDDSLTTRMLEQSILESAGYDVEIAVSGEEALDKARAKRYALFLVDVEMPGMDGFTFVERTRQEIALKDIPAMLVTSRSAPEDREKGFAAGAKAYVVKSEFDQGSFLQRIRELVH